MSQTPIEVRESVLPSQLAVTLRQMLLAASAWAIGRGYLPESFGDPELIAAVVFLIVFGLGQVNNVRIHRNLVTLAQQVPDEVAIVKE